SRNGAVDHPYHGGVPVSRPSEGSAMPVVDFTEILPGNTEGQEQNLFELFAQDFLEALGFRTQYGPGRGADRGRDLMVEERVSGTLSDEMHQWVVSAKHNAPRGQHRLQVASTGASRGDSDTRVLS